MRTTTLRQLMVFETAAKHLHFTRAAQILGMTQPSVSIQIKQLEENLGLRLFEQIGKRVFLTEAGQQLYQHCREIIHQLNQAETVIERLKGIEGGILKLSVGLTAKYFMPRLLAAFHQQYPGITIHMNVADSETLITELDENLCDMTIMDFPPENQDFQQIPLLTDPLITVAPPNHPLASANDIKLEQLANENFLVNDNNPETCSIIDQIFTQKNIAINVCMKSNSNEAIKQSVLAGIGLAIVPLQSVASELETKRLVVLDIVSLPLHRIWYVVHRREKQFSNVAEAFKNFLMQENQDIRSYLEIAGIKPSNFPVVTRNG